MWFNIWYFRVSLTTKKRFQVQPQGFDPGSHPDFWAIGSRMKFSIANMALARELKVRLVDNAGPFLGLYVLIAWTQFYPIQFHFNLVQLSESIATECSCPFKHQIQRLRAERQKGRVQRWEEVRRTGTWTWWNPGYEPKRLLKGNGCLQAKSHQRWVEKRSRGNTSSTW